MGPDSELTAKAREVLAGLSETARERLDALVRSGCDGADPCMYSNRLPRGTRELADASCVAVVRDSCEAAVWPTDLGREVARLLSEVQS